MGICPNPVFLCQGTWVCTGRWHGFIEVPSLPPMWPRTHSSLGVFSSFDQARNQRDFVKEPNPKLEMPGASPVWVEAMPDSALSPKGQGLGLDGGRKPKRQCLFSLAAKCHSSAPLKWVLLGEQYTKKGAQAGGTQVKAFTLPSLTPGHPPEL